MRIIEWQTDEPCVFDSGNLGYLTGYRVEVDLEPGHAVVLIDLEGSVVHEWPPHLGPTRALWVGEHLDRRTRLDARTTRTARTREGSIES